MSAKKNPFRKHRRFAPCLEALEGRDVPCTVTLGHGLLGGTDFYTPDLLIRGGREREAIVINDDGTQNGVTVTCNGATVWSGNEQVFGIIVHGGNASRDSVTYNLTGDLVATAFGGRTVQVQLGRGKADSFEANLNGNLIPILDLHVTGGRGGDRIETHLRGNLEPNSFFDLGLQGGAGRDVIGFDALPAVEVGAGSQLNVTLDGGSGNDVINAAYAGKLQGYFFFDAEGGNGNDTISAVLNPDADSTGSLFGPIVGNQSAALVGGGKGNDRLSLVVHHGPGLHAFTMIDGGPGHNTCHVEGNVDAVLHCQRMV